MSTNDINIYARGLNEETLSQIYKIAGHPSIVGRVAIQPDAHIGKGCVIGFTGKYENLICPNFIGVDIGCFTGNTAFKSKTPSGVSTFSDLINNNIKRIEVPSFNITKNMIEYINAYVMKTRCIAEVLMVHFTDGSYCHCTPDHKFLGKNLQYSEIQNIKNFPFELKTDGGNLSIDEISIPNHFEDVYCLYVPGTNNFFLSNGATVHNCGVITHKIKGIKKEEIDFESLDKYIRKNIPIGTNNRESIKEIDKFIKNNKNEVNNTIDEMYEFFKTNKITKKFISPESQFGTLGGGNHFIELEESETKDVYVTIHTGSRNFGSKVAEFYQRKAFDLCSKSKVSSINKENAYLDVNDEYGKSYLKFMKVAQKFSSINRSLMIKIILSFFNTEFSPDHYIESIHNYIDDENMIRKGAIKANSNQKVVIPLSMKRGVIIGEGLGNPDYNFSGPHGAGRKHSRSDLFRSLESHEITMDDYEKSMEGIFSTSVTKSTIDEWDGAYKDNNDILDFIKNTVIIKEITSPIYNLKA